MISSLDTLVEQLKWILVTLSAPSNNFRSGTDDSAFISRRARDIELSSQERWNRRTLPDSPTSLYLSLPTPLLSIQSEATPSCEPRTRTPRAELEQRMEGSKIHRLEPVEVTFSGIF